jgi:hypothetical protein
MNGSVICMMLCVAVISQVAFTTSEANTNAITFSSNFLAIARVCAEIQKREMAELAKRPKFMPGEVVVQIKDGADLKKILKKAGIKAKKVDNKEHLRQVAIADFREKLATSDTWYKDMVAKYGDINKVPENEVFLEAYSRMETTFEKELFRTHKVTLPDGMSVEKAVELLRASRSVESAKPNYLLLPTD